MSWLSGGKPGRGHVLLENLQILSEDTGNIDLQYGMVHCFHTESSLELTPWIAIEFGPDIRGSVMN